MTAVAFREGGNGTLIIECVVLRPGENLPKLKSVAEELLKVIRAQLETGGTGHDA